MVSTVKGDKVTAQSEKKTISFLTDILSKVII